MALTRTYGWQAAAVGDSVEAEVAAAGEPIRLGFIGVGDMGTFTLNRLLGRAGLVVTAVCDVDRARCDAAVERVAAHQGAPCAGYADFRELNRSDNVDAVFVSTPDHWHALQGIDAMRNGKDVYIEKPLTLTIAEGRAVSDTAAATGRICQTGTQQRSSREFRYACELIRNGYLGDIQAVNLAIPANNRGCDPVNGDVPVPDGFDYDRWLGPAPWAAYHPSRCHYTFRFISAYSGGQLTNWGAHMLDIVQWALDADSNGPVHVGGSCEFSHDGLFDTADAVDITWRYANGVDVRCTTGRPTCEFVGQAGRLTVGRGHFEASPEHLCDVTFAQDDTRLYRSDDHAANFLACIRTRRQPICPAEVGHRATTICHIANIALRLGRPLAWDPAAEAFVGDDEANAMRSRPMRAPWTL